MMLRSFIMFVKWTRVQENVYVRVAVLDKSACTPAMTETIQNITMHIDFFEK